MMVMWLVLWQGTQGGEKAWQPCATRPARTQVWNAVDNQAKRAHTSIIHGKYSHEETLATASFAQTYLIVRDLAEAQYVCDYIERGGDRAAFLAKFAKAVSPVRARAPALLHAGFCSMKGCRSFLEL